MAQKILITGGTGLVGRALTNLLISEGKEVIHLSRNPKHGGIKQYYWNPSKLEVDRKAFEGVDTIIHLAGEGVADKRWSKAHKKAILDSRIQSTQLLVDYLKESNHEVKSFISASAVGIYGPFPEGKVTETSKAGEGFLADVCVQWEAKVQEAKPFVENLAILRIGLVLSPEGGFLKAIRTPALFGMAAAFGSNKAKLPWVHIQDLVNMFWYASEKKIEGIYNATSPVAAEAGTLMKTLCEHLNRPYFLPAIPVPILNLLFGEMGGMLAASQDIVPTHLLQKGFVFQYTKLNQALADLLKNP